MATSTRLVRLAAVAAAAGAAFFGLRALAPALDSKAPLELRLEGPAGKARDSATADLRAVLTGDEDRLKEVTLRLDGPATIIAATPAWAADDTARTSSLLVDLRRNLSLYSQLNVHGVVLAEQGTPPPEATARTLLTYRLTGGHVAAIDAATAQMPAALLGLAAAGLALLSARRARR